MWAYEKDKPTVNGIFWRLVFFAILAGVVWSAEHYLLLALHPSGATELAVRQLRPSVAAADSLRLYEAVKNWSMTVSGCLVTLLAIVLIAHPMWARFGMGIRK